MELGEPSGRQSVSVRYGGEHAAEMDRLTSSREIVEEFEKMKTFGQVIRKARKSAGLAERLRRGDGRRVLPSFLNDLELGD